MKYRTAQGNFSDVTLRLIKLHGISLSRCICGFKDTHRTIRTFQPYMAPNLYTHETSGHQTKLIKTTLRATAESVFLFTAPENLNLQWE